MSPDEEDTLTRSEGSPPLPPFLASARATTPAPESPPLPIPGEFHQPRYLMGSQFGKGGMGGVWRATEATTGRTVAIKKILRTTHVSDFRRFLNEARLTAQLEHPNIVPVHELGLDGEGHVFYSMKLVQGADLADVLRKLAEGDPETLRSHPLAELLTVFQKICDAIAFAHSHNVIHRDLKPANIMLGPFGEVLVMDWGLAKLLTHEEENPGDEVRTVEGFKAEREGSSGSETLPGSAIGTAFYMAPEQARGEIHSHDGRTDIYALGAILYHILSLRRPVSGRSVQMLIARVANGDLDPLIFPARGDATRAAELPELPRPALRHLPGGQIPESLAAVIQRAMAFDPAQRYQRVADLQREITAYQGGFATTAERAGLGKQIFLALKRHRREATVAFAALLVVIAVAATSFVRIRRERDAANFQAERAERERATAEQQRALAENAGREAVRQESIARENLKSAEEARAAQQEQLREASRADLAEAEVQLLPARLNRPLALAYLGRALVRDPENADSQRQLWKQLTASAASRHALPALSLGVSKPCDFRLSPDENRIAISTNENTFHVAELPSGRESWQIPLTAEFLWTPDGRQLLTPDDSGGLALRDAKTGRIEKSFPLGGQYIRPLTFIGDSSLVIFDSNSPGLSCFDIAKGTYVWRSRQADGFGEAIVSPDRRYVALLYIESSGFEVLDLKTGKNIGPTLLNKLSIQTVAFSPNGRTCLVLTGEGQLHALSIPSGQRANAPKSVSGALDLVWPPTSETSTFLEREGDSFGWTRQPVSELLHWNDGADRAAGALFDPGQRGKLSASGRYAMIHGDNTSRLYSVGKNEAERLLEVAIRGDREWSIGTKEHYFAILRDNGVYLWDLRGFQEDDVPVKFKTPDEINFTRVESWCDDLVRAAGGCRFTANFEAITLDPSDRLAARERLRSLLKEKGEEAISDPHWRELLDWWLNPSSHRTVK